MWRMSYRGKKEKMNFNITQPLTELLAWILHPIKMFKWKKGVENGYI